MPNSNPNLNSLVSSIQFRTTAPSANPLYAGIVAGSTFVKPDFTGKDNAAEKDPGGLFGWLIYARNYRRNPPVGSTGDNYLVYRTPASFIADLNKLSGVTGVTHSLVSYTGSGGTFGFFNQTSAKKIELNGPRGRDLMHCMHYLAYGGLLVISGSTTGLDLYESASNNRIEILLGNTTNGDLCKYLENKPYMAGIFPSKNEGTSTTGAEFGTYFSNFNLISGNTVSDRIFSIYGSNGTTYNANTLQTGAELEYQISAIADVAGACNRAKSVKELFVSMAGLDRSTVQNKKIINPVDWYSTTRTLLKTNRVNFYVNYNPVFLGSDYVGATGSNADITIDDRFGPAFLKKTLTKEMTNVGIKYLFELNDATTRASVERECQAILDRYSYAIVRAESDVICDSTNNSPDFETSLTIEANVKTKAGTDTFLININLIP